jgi:hypothetical protein
MNRDVTGTLREIAERTQALRAGLADLAAVLAQASAAQADDAVQRDARIRAVSAYVAELEGRAAAEIEERRAARRSA